MVRVHRRVHAWFWSVAMLVLPAVIIAAVALKQTQRAPPPTVRLDVSKSDQPGLPPVGTQQ